MVKKQTRGQKIHKFIAKRWKALVAFAGAYVTALAGLVVNSGQLTSKEILLALAAAIATGAAVHQSPQNVVE